MKTVLCLFRQAVEIEQIFLKIACEVQKLLKLQDLSQIELADYEELNKPLPQGRLL